MNSHNSPNSPFQWLYMPLLVIYIIVVVVFLFKTNPELMAQSSLMSKLTKQKSDVPLITPDTSGFTDNFENQKLTSIYRSNLTRTNTAPESIKLRHRIMRAQVFQFSKIDENHAPVWAKDSTGYYALMGPKILSALDPKLQLNWNFKILGEKTKLLGPAIITEDFVFLSTSKGKVYSLNKQDGSLKWMLPLGFDVLEAPQYFNQALYLPVLSPDRNNFQILKIQAKTGEVQWKSEWIPQRPSSIISISEPNHLLVFGTMNGSLIAMSTKDSKIKWRFEESPSPFRGAPTIIKGRIFAANDAGMAYAVRVKNGKKAWEFQLKGGTTGSFTEMPTTDWIAIMTDSGYLHVIDRENGKSRWKFNAHNTKAFNTVKAMRMHKESITELELLWRYKGWVLVAPCRDTRLCFFNPKEGRILHRVRLRGTLASDLIFDKEDRSFVAMLESGTGPKTYFEKSPEDEKLPKWSMGFFLELKDFQRRVKALRAEALRPKPEISSEPATSGP